MKLHGSIRCRLPFCSVWSIASYCACNVIYVSGRIPVLGGGCVKIVCAPRAQMRKGWGAFNSSSHGHVHWIHVREGQYYLHTTVHVHIVWYLQYCGGAKRVIVTLVPCCCCLDARMLFDNTVWSHGTKGVKRKFGDGCVVFLDQDMT